MISITQVGDFSKTDKLLRTTLDKKEIKAILDQYARIGVDALSRNTPVDSGKTASSWGYETRVYRNKCEIIWTNDNINDNVNVAVIIQYGHGTKSGGYVYGIDYINPVVKPIFDSITNGVMREVIGS